MGVGLRLLPTAWICLKWLSTSALSMVHPGDESPVTSRKALFRVLTRGGRGRGRGTLSALTGRGSSALLCGQQLLHCCDQLVRRCFQFCRRRGVVVESVRPFLLSGRHPRL
ncbi:hypothetical protein WR25_03130 [Diploscapter pachys]|uniref:Secreted protein n=1 Tax=Diploscapter pachys TaxID=2018661 RepID=A0A2A2JU64_9BILA|nr:hypothetical protein WR25_03130 [Diploscapter pachys]